MRHRSALPCLLLSLSLVLGCAGSTSGGETPDGPGAEVAVDTGRQPLVYPASRRVEQVDRYHGEEIADPYRWLEQEGEETRAWVEAQDEVLESYVEPVAQRLDLDERLRAIRRFDSYGLPVRGGERYYFTLTPGGARHGALYEQRGLDGEPRRVLAFDDVIDEPGHRASGVAVSRDGRHVVWASRSQAGWGWLDVARVADGEVLAAERIRGVAGNSAIWTHDHRGFFYTHYGDYEALEAGRAEPRLRLMYHRLGTDPARDPVVYERPERPALLFSAKLSDDGRYLVLALMDGSSAVNAVAYKDLEAGDSPFLTLIAEPDALYSFEGNVGSRFFFRTTLDARRGRLVAVDLERPGRRHWAELIPERETPLGSVSHIGGRLVTVSTQHARPVVELWSTEGRRQSVLELPAIGLLSGFADDPESSVTFYRLNSLFDRGTIYRVDLKTGRSTVHHRPKLAYDPDDYEIKQVFYEGRDGARIPMFLAHRKDVALRGDRPLFMYGYGHGGWVAFPWFQPHLVAWLDLGGTYALPGLRGGGEYGREWQEAGTRRNKLTTLDDYIAAAEWLVEHGYTSPGKLVANGGSASGFLPAAAAVRRPELFAAAVIDFPFLDMLRYHHFRVIKGWTDGFGTAEDAADYEVLRSYSPLHNLRPGRCYPAMLTLVGGEDSSTPPLHGYKFTAALQAAQGCDRPGLLKFIPGAGHYSYGTTPEAAAETEAQILAFLIRTLGLRQPAAPAEARSAG